MPSEYKPNLGVVDITASTTLTPDAHAGKTVVLKAAAGLTITLPPATGSGYEYEIVVGTTVTSNNYIVRVTGNDVFAGVIGLSTDISGTVLRAAADSDTITMNGGTTGGIVGSRINVKDVSADVWALSGDLVTSGVEATPFSAAVS